MELTVICPAFNEIKYIDELVKSLCSDDGLQKEIFIVDGGSTDGTIEKVKDYAGRFPFLHYIHNPLRTSTEAFNLGYSYAKGKYIAFVGAHAFYNEGYFKTAAHYLSGGECEVVGGPLKQEGKTNRGKAVALAMSSKLGVGNTEFRTESKKMYVDSVAFAVYKREVIAHCGMMDAALPVNQDDEFHYRIKKAGFRILMVPEMQATYFVRDSYARLIRQYFRYGLYKPLVLKKVKGSVRLRHLVPSFFVLYLLSLPVCAFFVPWIFPLLLYLSLIFLRAITFDAKPVVRLLALPVFPLLHISYGSGFLMGLFKTA